MRLSRPAFLAAIALAAGLISAALGSAQAADRIGMVMLHGGGSNGSQFDLMAPVLEAAGYGIEAPDLCWSGGRRYDKSAEECMVDVDKAFAKLKARGFTRFVIAGHSQGGINAILYAAYHKDLAGLIAYAPSSPPKGDATNGNVAYARELVRKGQGDIVTAFAAGINDIMATPKAYLSYVGQESPLYDNELLPKITAPILWVAGTDDPGQSTATERMKAAPLHPLNAFVMVKADHFATPDEAVKETIAWLDRLSASLVASK